METIEKMDIRKMKNDIKELVKTQKWLKNQRKTVNKNCSRKKGDPADISHSQATWMHAENRYKLRILYSVYNQARGHDPIRCDHLNFQEDWMRDEFLNKVKTVSNTYKIKVKVESVEIGKMKNDEV